MDLKKLTPLKLPRQAVNVINGTYRSGFSGLGGNIITVLTGSTIYAIRVTYTPANISSAELVKYTNIFFGFAPDSSAGNFGRFCFDFFRNPWINIPEGFVFDQTNAFFSPLLIYNVYLESTLTFDFTTYIDVTLFYLKGTDNGTFQPDVLTPSLLWDIKDQRHG